ncbi:MAG TPA: AraC family transcriptional regulator [Lachnospiraceae bacterium]|nr:AraC family transcriptional regulator [Lachnospiraceae bacterium]
MPKTASERVLVTPSSYTKSHYLYVQETGTLKSLQPHISRREKLESFLFFIVTEGSGNLTFQNISYPIKSGDCVWLSCLESYSHESSVSSPWSLKWVHFFGPQASSFYSRYKDMGGPILFTPASISPYGEILQALFQTQRQKNALSDLVSHNLLTNLITQTFSDTLNRYSGASIPEKFTKVRNYIEEHYHEKISLDQLSELFYLSKYHLVREYQRLFGITILNDLTVKRLSHAKSMLRFTDESIESIAAASGFQTSSYFIKVFKRFENITPLEYRRKW